MRRTTLTFLVLLAASIAAAQVDGFPVSLGAGELPLWGAPAVVDAGTKVFVLIGSTDESLYAYYLDGTEVPGFPVALPGPVRSKVAWEPDGENIAIFVITANGYLCRIDWNGTTTNSVFTHSQGESANYISPVLDDVDDDGVLEVFAVIDTSLFCYSFDGIFLWQAEFYSSIGFAVATPAVGDVNGDGSADIIVEGYEALFAFDAFGAALDSFPLELIEDVKFSYSSPLLWDCDDDGLLEIFCGAHEISDANIGLIYAIDADSASLENSLYGISGYGNWIYSSAAVGDVNGDYSQDITFGSINGTVFGIDGDGTLVSFGGVGIHLSMGHIYGSVLLCDVDSTPGPEYIFQMFDENEDESYLVVMDPGAAYIDSFPDTMSGENSGVLTPVTFVLGESTYIAAATGDGELWLWGIPATPLPGYAHWTELFGDRRNRSIAPPNAPALEIQEGDSSQYILSWSRSEYSEFAAYLLYHSPDSAGTESELISRIDDVAETSFVHESDSPAESLWFFVLVEDSMGRTSLRSVPKSAVDTYGIAETHMQPRDVVLTISPNPFNGSCEIRVPGAQQVDILSLDGRLLRVLAISPSSGTAVLRDDGLLSGVLLLRAKDADGRTIAVGKTLLLR